jgi:eukaryotic-like serine/threonine-protein kinase
VITPAAGVVIAGRYELTGPLAQGGMGSLWIARHKRLDVLRAIKFIDPTLLSAENSRARFEREAKAAAQIDSHHVVHVYDYGAENDTPYIVMELLKGEDLGHRLLREKRLPIGAVATILIQAAKALREAHEVGIVHRDLKPGNIFLAQKDGEIMVKVLDFGIAKVRGMGAIGEATKTGTLIGSVHFMSPEQARGSKDIDHRSDLWSLAVIAFRALTGQHPFPGHDMGDVIVKICAEPVPLASQRAPGLPSELDDFFARGLARDPSQRFQSACELAAAFNVLANGAQPLAAPPVARVPHVGLDGRIREHPTVKARSPGAVVFSLDSSEESRDSMRDEAGSPEGRGSGADKGPAAGSGLRVKANPSGAIAQGLAPTEAASVDPVLEANVLEVMSFSLDSGEQAGSDPRVEAQGLAVMAFSLDPGEEAGSDPRVEAKEPEMMAYGPDSGDEADSGQRAQAEALTMAAFSLESSRETSGDLRAASEPPAAPTPRAASEPPAAPTPRAASEPPATPTLRAAPEPCEEREGDAREDAEPPEAIVPSGESMPTDLAAPELRSDDPPALVAQPPEPPVGADPPALSASSLPAVNLAPLHEIATLSSSSASFVISAPIQGIAIKPASSRRRALAWAAGACVVALALATAAAVGGAWRHDAAPAAGVSERADREAAPSLEAPVSPGAPPSPAAVSLPVTSAVSPAAPAASSNLEVSPPAITTRLGEQRAETRSSAPPARSAVRQPQGQVQLPAPGARAAQQKKIPLP